MIHMPRRSVTRFFIPLIDVLLLLFCIFLLMPFVAEEDPTAVSSKAKVEDQAEEIERLKRQLARQKEQLAKLRHLRSPQEEIDRLRAELEKAQAELKKMTKDKLYALHRNMRLIEVNGLTGELAYYNPADVEQPVVKIDSAKVAAELIERLRKESGGKELFFQFYVVPRDPNSGRPSIQQLREYRKWFAKAPNSLQEVELP
jgi:biopolymer transport protein ExbD